MHEYSKFDYSEFAELEDLASSGTAYIKRITADQVLEISDVDEDLITESEYWALFSEDGIPLMLANARQQIEHSAFFNDVTTVLPN